MDRIQWQRLGDAVKNYLLSKKSREFFVFAFFFLVSAGFWFIQTLNDTFDMEVQVPMAITNVPDEIIITDSLPSPLRVTVRDKGMSLMRYYRKRAKAPVQVDFKSHLKEPGGIGRVILSSAEVQKLLSTYLLNSSRIVAIHPDTIDYYYNYGDKKRVPVMLQGQVGANPLYYIADVKCEPDSVIVLAPSSVLDTIQSARIDVSDITDLTHNETHVLKVLKAKGTRYIPDEVKVTSSVDMYTEKSVSVPIVGINFPGDKSLITFPSTAKVTFRIGTKLYKEIDENDVVVAVTYEELLQCSENSFRLHLRSVPEGVSQVRISPEKVDFLIEQTDE